MSEISLLHLDEKQQSELGRVHLQTIMKEREAFLMRAMTMSVTELFSHAVPDTLSEGQKEAWGRHEDKRVLDILAEVGYGPLPERVTSDFAHMSETTLLPFNPLNALWELLPEKDPRAEILGAI